MFFALRKGFAVYLRVYEISRIQHVITISRLNELRNCSRSVMIQLCPDKLIAPLYIELETQLIGAAYFSRSTALLCEPGHYIHQL